jgi:hypothetical protein
MTVDAFDPKHGQLVGFPFFATNIVTAATNTDMAVGQATVTLLTMPKAGSIVGLSVDTNAAVTGGTCTFTPHKSSTEYAASGYPAPVLASTTGVTLASYVAVRKGICTFSAGDSVGVSYTTSTDLAPSSTNEVNAVLWVLFNRD